MHAIVNGRVDQLVERFGGLEVEVIVLRVADEEPASFEQPGDAFADGRVQILDSLGQLTWQCQPGPPHCCPS